MKLKEITQEEFEGLRNKSFITANTDKVLVECAELIDGKLSGKVFDDYQEYVKYNSQYN